MPSASTLALFCSAALILLIIPGPSVLFIVTRSVEHGRRAGLVSVVGTHAGSLVHVAGAAFGLSTLIVSSAIAFSAVKYLGAAYLIWLGVRRWRAGDRSLLDAVGSPAASGQVFRQALLVSALNPKTAIFFLAFLPQFVEIERGAVTVQVLVLGLVFIALGFISDGTYALAASALGRVLRRSRRARLVERYVSTSVYLGLGATAAATGGHVSATA